MTRDEQVEARRTIEIAEKGLKNSVPIETISIMTGLSIDEVENLKTATNEGEEYND